MFHVEQNLSNEIINILMKGDLHPRGLANKLGTNHMTVSRKLQNLNKENIVDYRIEGKNKIFFVKKSIEGRNAVMIVEIYKQSRILHWYPGLRGIFKSVQNIPDVSFALLFGSYAKGLATKESDIDIFIETLNPSIREKLEKKHSSLSIKIGEFDPGSLLIREIIKDHVVIKGVEMYLDKTGILKETA
jgi:predicted nucleotidyltransferase